MRQAAEDGVADAQFWLGVAYEQDEFGVFGVRDEREALKWYRKAAEQGNPDAEVELGRCYEDGRGVEQDYALAAQWYRKAAEHVPNLGGAGQGRNDLGLLYMEGPGVPKDYVQAYMWFSLAGTEANLAAVQVETRFCDAGVVTSCSVDCRVGMLPLPFICQLSGLENLRWCHD
jgi:uncharacterized protein